MAQKAMIILKEQLNRKLCLVMAEMIQYTLDRATTLSTAVTEMIL